MSKASKLNLKDKNLIRRYLLWCYKTTKEDLDRIDRYQTQFVVDEYLLQQMEKRNQTELEDNAALRELVNGFDEYLKTKKKKADRQKFKGVKQETLKPEYQYLRMRLDAIEKSIVHFLGKKELNRIIDAYEDEMVGRILEAREHK